MVRSADGTRIGFAKIGSGPGLVIIHGVLNSAEEWLPVARLMAEHCTSYVMDRRGRGRSEDGTEYSFDREIEDIEAVLDAAGPRAFLLGHSSGGIYALEVARRRPLAGLVLYEPPLHYRGRFQPIFDRIRVLVHEGRFEEAVTVFVEEEAELPEDALSGLRASDAWPRMVARAPTLLREWGAIYEAGPTIERHRDVSVPTLLLSGTETRNHPSLATRALEARLADVRTAVLEGQGHTANQTAPDRVAEEVVGFLLSTAR